MEAAGAAHVTGSETGDYSNKIKRVASSTIVADMYARFSPSRRAGARIVRIISAP